MYLVNTARIVAVTEKLQRSGGKINVWKTWKKILAVDDRIFFLPTKHPGTFKNPETMTLTLSCCARACAKERADYIRSRSQRFKHQSSEASPTVNFIQQRWSRFWLCSCSVSRLFLLASAGSRTQDLLNFIFASLWLIDATCLLAASLSS